jgi:hypothetical protein
MYAGLGMGGLAFSRQNTPSRLFIAWTDRALRQPSGGCFDPYDLFNALGFWARDLKRSADA